MGGRWSSALGRVLAGIQIGVLARWVTPGLVDEVLAVGDEEFQEKCFARIEAFKREGRTLLFVSHEMTDVLRVATRAVWVEQGRVRMDGRPDEIVEEYLAEAHHET